MRTTGPGHYRREYLCPPRAEWANRFDDLASELDRALGCRWQIEHVGSTAIPGIAAKPVIDLAVRIPPKLKAKDAATPLGQHGWSSPRELGSHWVTFRLDGGVRVSIAHMFSAAQWPRAHVRLFTQWLLSHPKDAQRYAALKMSLVDEGKWGHDYTRGKADFVNEIVDRARSSSADADDHPRGGGPSQEPIR